MPDQLSQAFRRSMPATICRHFSRLLSCSVGYLNADNSVRCTFVSGRPQTHLDDGRLFKALFGSQTVVDRPNFKLARQGETYVSIDLFQEGTFIGRLVAGPIGDDYEHLLDKKQQFSSFGESNIVVSAAALLYYFVYEKWVDADKLYQAAVSAKLFIRKKERDESVPINTHHTYPLHHTITYENQIYSMITQGNSKSLEKAINASPDGVYGLLDKRFPLRNLKNDCICTLTLATRAAIAGGLDSETAFSLSDDAIQRVELYDDVDKLNHMVKQVLFQLTDLVESIHNFNHSYRVNYCRNYILRNIREKLTVSEIAKHVGVSPEYLTKQFKKETGVCLKTFIEQLRLEEAKRLLLSTDKTVLEITLLLNYHDQSHFIRSFKKEAGITPAVFRNSNRYCQSIF